MPALCAVVLSVVRTKYTVNHARGISTNQDARHASVHLDYSKTENIPHVRGVVLSEAGVRPCEPVRTVSLFETNFCQSNENV